jgi:hypothetical protein
MTQAERNELDVRCQVILSAGPAAVDEEAAWGYVREMAGLIRSGREGLLNLRTIEQLAELWRLKHQRGRLTDKTSTVLARIGRRLHARRERFNIFSAAAKAGGAR